MTSTFKEKLFDIAPNVQYNEEMKKHTSFKIGGPVDAFVDAASELQIQQIIDLCKESDIRLTFIGNGSNLLVSDNGIDGVVLKIGSGMQDISIQDDIVYAKSGILLSKLANTVASEGLSGLEFAAGIPGTLGGGIYMNAGAYGGELKDVITNVTYIDNENKIKTASGSELDFSYRHSVFSDSECVILSCEMKLNKRSVDDIKAEMANYQQRRVDKQPLNYPSAGSTFRRPDGYFAGQLIEDSNLKGYSIGGAEVSVKHSGFVINKGGATCNDVINLIAHIKNVVYKNYNVMLETEVRFIGRKN